MMGGEAPMVAGGSQKQQAAVGSARCSTPEEGSNRAVWEWPSARPVRSPAGPASQEASLSWDRHHWGCRPPIPKRPAFCQVSQEPSVAPVQSQSNFHFFLAEPAAAAASSSLVPLQQPLETPPSLFFLSPLPTLAPCCLSANLSTSAGSGPWSQPPSPPPPLSLRFGTDFL